MSLTNRLGEYVAAAFTGIWIQSHEHADALSEIGQLCRDRKWSSAVWDVDRGLQVAGARGQAAGAASTSDPISAIRSINALATADGSAILVLPNFHRFLQSAEVVQAIAHQVQQGKQNRTFVVILSPIVQVPVELEKHFVILEHDRLGRLYNPTDYPPTLRGLFAVDFDFPSVDAPEYLARLNPELYAQERRRISERFDEAVRLAEEAFVGEFSKLVSHLVERLTAGPDGERKVFRDSAVNNLREFFDRFKHLNVRSNADLDRLVETASQTLSGVDPHIVRNSNSLRQQVTTQLSAVQSVLDGMLVDQPRRRILRQGRGNNGAGGEVGSA
ncbi:hypothetical protein [Humisphaera borealis]|uniref:ATP-binding protein n=1 Tax=Humisphaera borealis TaxID=2807512 RepID=A0A7M2WZ70_9BACT|nr:hypothetical protein [Humisphaera borealis]QOV89780.1 hypothetical protein IPV69_26960 [Humisphaera borealis]